MAQKKKRDRTPNVPRDTGPTAPAGSTGSTKQAAPKSGQPSAAKASQSAKKSSAAMSQRERKRRQQWIITAAVAVAAVALVALLIVLNNRERSQASGTPPAPSTLPADLISWSTKGRADAPVTVTVFSDFECPACKSFAQGIEKQIEEKYVLTGKVRYEYKHLPLPQHNPGANWAANAAECAADQGRFWDMHAYLFQEGGTALSNNFTQGRLRDMAAALGLDTAKFNDCLSREQFGDRVQADVREARRLNVNSTPTVFVNGQRVDIAAQGYQGVITAIEAALAAAGQG
ncbi:MAG: DsbA family protein [Caldilineales bacterium]|nr:DsbA family protein [Caldilineales bacterium]MDW8318202.1 thioredoxin domain-containing protein [Anaerolineae bacterium]